MARTRGFEATADMSRASEPDALIICVPTPLSAHREPDLSFIVNTIETALPHMRAGQLVSLESTTWPGTTDEVLAPKQAELVHEYANRIGRSLRYGLGLTEHGQEPIPLGPRPSLRQIGD